jgi:3-oxoacyl-[acyl-carrier-protein] synthase III
MRPAATPVVDLPRSGRADLVAGFEVAGWGTALPERAVDNDWFAQRLETSDEWIRARTGIRERRVGAPHETTGFLATAAAQQALARAGIAPSQLDVIVVATSTPEQPVPSTAAGVATQLGTSAGSFDVNAACAGFVYGLVVTSGLLTAGAARTALLVGSDTMTRFADPDDRSTAVLFGDGAGALVLTAPATAPPAATTAPSASPQGGVDATVGLPGGLLASDLIDDPEASQLLVIPAGGSARPPSFETVEGRQHYLQMDGREVFRRAVRSVADSIVRTLDRAGCTPDDVELFVPHQANARIIDAVLDRVGIDAKRTLQTVERHGNTSSASVPLALAEAVEDGRLHDGTLVLTSGFGAGLTVGTALLRWSPSKTVQSEGHT